jgi:hypothetical protein
VTEPTTRNVLVVGAIVLAVLSVGAGALIAVSSEGAAAPDTGITPSTSSPPTVSDSPTGTPEPPETEAPAAAETASSILEDGRHLVYVDTAFLSEDGPARIRFDLVYFHTGAEAEEVAEAHGEDAPNGYYIENDNPRLRTLPLADEVEVEYVPEGRCCELQPGNVDAWLGSVTQTSPTDYPEDAPWWFTVEDGRITRIEQQFLA